MNKINKANFPMFIRNADRTVDIPLNGMDCMAIHLYQQKLNAKMPETPTQVISGYQKMRIDLITKRAYFLETAKAKQYEKEVLKLEQIEPGERRPRGDYNLKSQDGLLI